jgi:hypothetical protein
MLSFYDLSTSRNPLITTVVENHVIFNVIEYNTQGPGNMNLIRSPKTQL